MFGIRYCKFPPTHHVIHFKNGAIKKDGLGLSFFYYAPNSDLAKIPVTSQSVPFVFQELTSDFQEVTVQGNFNYRVTDAKVISESLDFTVNARGSYRSDDPQTLSERLTNLIQARARTLIQKSVLTDVLNSNDALIAHVKSGLELDELFTRLAVTIDDVTVESISATPDMTKALQADAREKLLMQADQAMHERRQTGVEMERKIQEMEMETEISIEQQRTELIDQKVENDKKESDAQAYGLKANLEPLQEVDWRLLMAARGNLESDSLIAMAFRDLADNAEKIGNLNISPELLETLTQKREQLQEHGD